MCRPVKGGGRTILQGTLEGVHIINERATGTPYRRTRPSSPINYRVVNVISNGSNVCGTTYSTVKRYARQNKMDTPKALTRLDKDSQPITFDESNAQGLMDHQHDGLVISLSITNTLVRRVLINTGSSTNLIMLDTVRVMGLSESDIVKKSMVLVGFNGGAEHIVGEIVLPSYARGINLQVMFLVLNCPTLYNVILGGVGEIEGDQRIAKECYMETMKIMATAPPTPKVA